MSDKEKKVRKKTKKVDLSLKFQTGDVVSDSLIGPVVNIVEGIGNEPITKCPKGTRKNKKTGICEPIDDAAKSEKTKCPKGTRKNKKTGICEPVEKAVVETIAEPMEELVEEPMEELAEPIPGILKKCPKGTRKNKKTGECEPIAKTTKCPNGTRKNKKTGECEPIPEKASKKPENQPEPPSEKPSRKPTQKIDIGEPDEKAEKNDIKAEASSNKDLLTAEKKEYEALQNQTETDPYDFLYPDLNDPYFNEKIAQHKEFEDTKYDGTIHDIKKQADILCNAKFELMPHQIFVKNFLSMQTPYNSLLLYHGLGSGKTCSSIGIAEEMRAYMKQLNITQRILIVASPNVQSNFRLQLFDERKLKPIPGSDGMWNIESCVGNSLLKEINPTSLKGMSQEKVISSIKRIINQYYLFLGYGQLTNYIFSAIKRSKDIENMTKQQRKKVLIKSIRELFDNRLLIIDEVHNIRLANDNKEKKKTALLLMQVAKYSRNMRMLLLSATPLFNSYKEIIWLVNLMNINDKRATIDISEIFDAEGNFKEMQDLGNGEFTESGKELLMRKLNGYISYVRGENPYTFPYRVYPEIFAPERTFKENPYPEIQMNGSKIDDPIQHIHIYLTKIGEYQKKGYKKIIDIMKEKSYDAYTATGKARKMPTFENMESFGYTLLQHPIESLNMVYPSKNLEIENEDENVIESLVGKSGLDHVMKYKQENQAGIQIRYDFEYKDEIMEEYGEIFSEAELPKYSAKIAEICNIIKKSKGIIAIYSQYIDGGIVPIALALESMGFTRFSTARDTKNLFKSPPKPAIDALTMKSKSEMEGEFRPAKYVMITGDKAFSPNNAEDIKFVTNADNKYGEQVRVILLSKAGAEGLDFKNIRQIHVLEPWYNMNRIEQIIGRGVRNLSHCTLPFEERNVEIYLHGTELRDESNKEEAADLYVYRLAEKKAIQIGRVTRLMKSVAVDCLLNIDQTNFTVQKLNELAANKKIKINLSSLEPAIQYQIGDQPFTEVCDYMDNCEYKCAPKEKTQKPTKTEYYNTNYLQSNQEIIMAKIRELFREKTPKKGMTSEQPTVSHIFYERNELINAINIVKEYPQEQIFSALSQFINNPNEYLVDAYGRTGRLIDKYNEQLDVAYYAFQPIEITDENASIYHRSVPVEYKRRSIFLKMNESKQPLPVIDSVPQSLQEAPSIISDSLYENILKDLEISMEYLFHTSSLNKGEKNWYKHAGMIVHYSNPQHKYSEIQKTKKPDKTIEVKTIQHTLPITQLREQFKITDENIKKYMVEHFIEVLSFQDKMILLNHFYDSKAKEPTSEYEKMMKSYFDARILQSNELICITIMKEETLIIMVNTEKNGKTIWKEADEEDYEIIGKELLKYQIPRRKENMNELLGFVTLFISKKSNAKEMVFKIKDMTEKRNNFGARIDDAGKDKVIKILNKIVKSTYYNDDNTLFISQLGLCVAIELLMRHFSAIQHDGKYYYLTPEQTVMSEIIKKSFQ
jgi:hypothetical protein